MRSLHLIAAGLLLAASTLGHSQQASDRVSLAPFDRARAPQSPWIAKERAWAREVLATTKADVVVAPLQVEQHAFDVVERNLIARSLAAGLAKTYGLSVADTTLVERALGSSARRFPDEDVFAVASQVGARTVVLGYIGHDGAGRFDLRIETVRMEAGKPVAGGRRTAAELEDVPFGDTALPYAAVLAKRNELLAGIAQEAVRTPSAQQAPAAPGGLTPRAQGLRLANLLQLVGTLHPIGIHDRARERLFERSLVALEGLEDEPSVRLLKARAWASLYRRPAALAALQQPETPEAKALAAYLDGNVERLAPLIATIGDESKRMLATIDLERLKGAYQLAVDLDGVQRLAASVPPLQWWIRQAVAEANPFVTRSNALVKLGLDSMFPDPRFTRDLGPKADALPEPDIAELALDHVTALRSANPSWWVTGEVGNADYVDLAEQMLIANAVVPAREMWAGGRGFAAAHRLTSSVANLFDGHPEFTLMHGLATISDQQGPRIEQAARIVVGGANVRLGTLWTQGQDLTMQRLTTLSMVYFADLDKLGPRERAELFFDDDWPSRAGWTWSTTGRPTNLAQCIAYTIENAGCLFALYAEIGSEDMEAAHKIVVANDHRFAGHPQLGVWRADVRDTFNEPASAPAVAIGSGSLDWQVYREAGIALAKQGKAREALETFRKYPGFHGSGSANPVDLSNYAYDAGSVLFWGGYYEEARPLFQIASSLDTGSDASISSTARLALIDGDLGAAGLPTFERALRYGTEYAIRDLLLYLAAYDQKLVAWTTLRQLEHSLIEPELWEGALAVHRVEGAPREEIAEWALRGQRPQLRTRLDSLPLRYLFMSEVVDRKVTADGVAALRGYDPGPQTIRKLGGRIETNGKLEFTMQASYGEWIQWALPNGVESLPIDSRLTMAAAGLAALDAGDNAKAFAIFYEASATYELREFLPYFAWASALVDDTSRINGYLAKVSAAKAPETDLGVMFDEYLSYAALSAARGEHDVALSYLVKANADVLYTDDRALPARYQVLDIAERLYRRTNEPKYRSWLVDLARRNTVIDPAQSWAHAFVGLYSDDPQERRVELARAVYLDASSYRAALAPARELEAARVLAARGNPLLPQEADASL